MNKKSAAPAIIAPIALALALLASLARTLIPNIYALIEGQAFEIGGLNIVLYLPYAGLQLISLLALTAVCFFSGRSLVSLLSSVIYAAMPLVSFIYSAIEIIVSYFRYDYNVIYPSSFGLYFINYLNVYDFVFTYIPVILLAALIMISLTDHFKKLKGFARSLWYLPAVIYAVYFTVSTISILTAELSYILSHGSFVIPDMLINGIIPDLLHISGIFFNLIGFAAVGAVVRLGGRKEEIGESENAEYESEPAPEESHETAEEESDDAAILEYTDESEEVEAIEVCFDECDEAEESSDIQYTNSQSEENDEDDGRERDIDI